MDGVTVARELVAFSLLSVASRRRGNHSSGTVSERPSRKWTTKASGMNSSPRARGSALIGEVLMPPLDEEGLMLKGQLANPPQLRGAIAVRERQPYGLQP